MVFKFAWQKKADEQLPIIWSTFQAKSINSDTLTEFCIKDLPSERFEEAFTLLTEDYLVNEPVNASLRIGDDPKCVEAFRSMCQDSLNQKVALACFDVSTDKLVAANILWIISKEDNFSQQLKDIDIPYRFRVLMDSLEVLYGDFNATDAYGVDCYISSFGLSVAKEYTQRGIATKMLKTRKLIGDTYGIKLSHTIFSSNASNRGAETVGFKIDRSVTYGEIVQADPKYQPFATITHEKLTAKTWVF